MSDIKEFKAQSQLPSTPPPCLFEMMNEPHLYLHSKEEKCIYNQHGQCIKGFRYFCAYCNYGLGGMFSTCQNNKCDIPKNNDTLFTEKLSDFITKK